MPGVEAAPLLVLDGVAAYQQAIVALRGVSLTVQAGEIHALRYAHQATVLDTGRTVLQGPAPLLRQREDIQSFYFGQGSGQGTLTAVSGHA